MFCFFMRAVKLVKIEPNIKHSIMCCAVMVVVVMVWGGGRVQLQLFHIRGEASPSSDTTDGSSLGSGCMRPF